MATLALQRAGEGMTEAGLAGCRNSRRLRLIFYHLGNRSSIFRVANIIIIGEQMGDR